MSLSLSLPPRPSVEQLKKQAKDLLKAHKQGDVAACDVYRKAHRFSESTDQEILESAVSLQETQFALALAYGQKDWKALLTHVESVNADTGGSGEPPAAGIAGEGAGSPEPTAEDSAVVQLVNKIILDAHDRGASDIHVEPMPGKQPTTVRMRVDGNMYAYETIPHNYKSAVISRLKIMSGMDVAVHRMPQDGKLTFSMDGDAVLEARVATIPARTGENVVLRILAAGDPIPLAAIGLTEENYKNLVSAVTRPYGIVFVCGPTGSGKTTTLHSVLGYINRPENKIYTVEDPIEIIQRGLVQVQAQPKEGLDFSAALRSFLRADPDVIMVGELRDKETATTCLETSLTGHMVFTTLHTNSSPASITRLLDIGVDAFNLADAILCVLSQRLVNTLCKFCREAYHPAKEEYEELVLEYGGDDFIRHLNIPYAEGLKLNKSKGCPECNDTGYRGRMAIHELLMGTDALKKLTQDRAPEEEIRSQAMADGMVTLRQDGIGKIFDGNCDLLQVRKACI